MAREIHRVLLECQEVKIEQWGTQKRTDFSRFPCAKATHGDLVFVKEASHILHTNGHHLKLVHNYFTGPWKVVNVVKDRLSSTVQRSGRKFVNVERR